MYSIEFSETALKQLNKLERNIKERMINVLERVIMRPFHFIKRKEGSPYFILRVGDYRAILDVRQGENKIFVIKVGHRKDIYEN